MATGKNLLVVLFVVSSVSLCLARPKLVWVHEGKNDEENSMKGCEKNEFRRKLIGRPCDYQPNGCNTKRSYQDKPEEPREARLGCEAHPNGCNPYQDKPEEPREARLGCEIQPNGCVPYQDKPEEHHVKQDWVVRNNQMDA